MDSRKNGLFSRPYSPRSRSPWNWCERKSQYESEEFSGTSTVHVKISLLCYLSGRDAEIETWWITFEDYPSFQTHHNELFLDGFFTHRSDHPPPSSM